MSERLSGRGLATALGVDEGAVRKAVKAGRIAKGDDGKFDLDACRQAWTKSTDPARSKVVRTDADRADYLGPKAVVRTEADAHAAIALIARVLKAEGAEAGEIDYNAARTADTILKAYERDLKMAQRRKELVPAAETAKHFASSFTGYRQAIQRLPSRHVPQMAAELGVDPGALERLLDKAIAAELNALSAPVVRA